MKKIILVFAALLIAGGCSASKKISPPVEQSSEKLSLKARDHYLRGLFHEDEEEYNRALVEFYQALHHDSTSPTIYNSIAENHIRLGHFDSAQLLLNKAQKLDPGNLETISLLAESYFRLHKDEEAISIYKELLSKDPYNEEARRILLFLLEKNHKTSDLAIQYEKLVELYGERIQYFEKLVDIYIKNKNYTAALRVLDEMIEYHPGNYRALYFKGLIYEAKEKPDSAAAVYEQAYITDPDAPLALEKLIELYLRQRKHDKALILLNERLRRDSSSLTAHYFKGRIFEDQNQLDSAKVSYKHTLEIDPDYVLAVEHLAMIHRREQNWDAIIELYSPLLEHENNRTALSALIMISEAEYYLKNYQRVRELLVPILEDPETPWGAHDLMGRIELEQKNYTEAENYFSQILKKDRKNKLAWLFLGFTYSDQDLHAKAEDTYKEAITEIPSDPSLWAFYGISLQSQEKYQQAMEPLERALELDPNHLNALTSLPVIYESLKLYDKTDSLYAIALNRYPENDLLKNNYAYSLCERDMNLDKALELVTDALVKNPENGAYLDTIGWIYYKMGRYEDAVEFIHKAIEQRENSPVVLEHLGDVYFKLDELAKAKLYWKLSLEQDPDNESLKKKLESTE